MKEKKYGTHKDWLVYVAGIFVLLVILAACDVEESKPTISYYMENPIERGIILSHCEGNPESNDVDECLLAQQAAEVAKHSEFDDLPPLERTAP